jgi:predicted O-linked N-acetylglucosamine transferase (SPINDLY family)
MAAAREQLDEALRHHQASDYAKAHAIYSEILDREPENVDAWNLLGLLLHQLKRPELAFAMIAKAITLKPDYAEAHNNLANVLWSMRHMEEAVRHFRRAVEIKPTLGAAWFNLGDVLRNLGRFAEAVEPYRRAETLMADNALAPFHLSCVLEATGQAVEAEAAARRSVAMEPESPTAWIVLGRALIRQDKQLEAAKCLEEALRLQPDKIETLLETAGTFERWRMPDRAAHFYKLILQRDPENGLALSRLFDMQLTLCDWREYDRFCAKVIGRIEREMADDVQVTTDVFNLHALPVSQEFTYKVARHKAKTMAREAAAARTRCNFTFSPKSSGKIRIGYLLPYTTKQSMPLVLEPVVEKHDRDRFEIFGYSLMSCDGVPFSVAFRKHFDQFCDLVKVSPEVAAQRIFADGIDIIIDTTGHTSVNWLEVLALQPAPVQAHYLGYSLTTGSDFVQYLITDRKFIPPEWKKYCTEELVYLPGSFMATRRAEISDTPVTRADCNIPSHAFVFANFNHPCKFEPGIFTIWMRLLRRLPQAVFWLGDWMHATRDHLRREAEACGVDGNRLIFAKLEEHPKHLARLRLADLALDNRFHGGGVTTVDALWAGLPVLTVASESPAARLGATLVSAADMPELVMPDFDTYEARAIEFAEDPDLLQKTRDKLWSSRATCQLFDTDRYRRNLEEAYQAMWDNHVSGRGPHQIEVPPGR